MTDLPLSVFTTWLAQGQRGLSSESIVSHLTGARVGRDYDFGRVHYPHDPDDLRRCERLLREVPLARLTFSSMRSASPQWAVLEPAWAELVALLEEECPGIIDQSHPHGRAPRTYARMKEVLAAASVVAS